MNFVIQGLFFQVLQVVVFALRVEGGKVVLFFFADLLLFDQPGFCRAGVLFLQIVEVRIQVRYARARSGIDGMLSPPRM